MALPNKEKDVADEAVKRYPKTEPIQNRTM